MVAAFPFGMIGKQQTKILALMKMSGWFPALLATEKKRAGVCLRLCQVQRKRSKSQGGGNVPVALCVNSGHTPYVPHGTWKP